MRLSLSLLLRRRDAETGSGLPDAMPRCAARERCRMICSARLFDGVLICTQTAAHVTHTYVASAGYDLGAEGGEDA